MKFILSSFIILTIFFSGCKTRLSKIEGGGKGESTGTGVNTSRSNIKNDIDTKANKTKEEKKK